jgi:hypothetical protein
MLRIAQLEEFERLLLRLPELVTRQEQRSTDFPASVGVWLKELEQAMAAPRLYQAAAIAALRSGLIAAEQGQLPAGYESLAGTSRARVAAAVASAALRRATDVTAALIEEHRPRSLEGERVAQQIVAIARSQDLIRPDREKQGGPRGQALRRELANDEGLERALVHLEGLVGAGDTLLLLERASAAAEAQRQPVERGEEAASFNLANK